MSIKNKIFNWLVKDSINELKNATTLTLPDGKTITVAQWCSYVNNDVIPGYNKIISDIKKKTKGKK